MITDMIQFATTDMAQAAGFPNIRAMREAFHTRAQVRLLAFQPNCMLRRVLSVAQDMPLTLLLPQALYEAGCERDLSNQIRICLLLSQRRKYPGGMFDNERWTIRAQHLLQQAEKPPLVSQTTPRCRKSSRWRLLSCCCLIRAQRVIIGTHRNASIATVPLEIPSITEADLEEDLDFPWYLDVATKRELAQVFMAFVDLSRVMHPLCHVVLRNEPKTESGPKGLSRTIPFRGSVLGPLEEVESSLVEWRAYYSELFLTSWDNTRSPGAATPSCLTVAYAYINLTYEFVASTLSVTYDRELTLELRYCISHLHQISLDSERSSTTSWAARMRESSREALQVSAASTTRILRDLYNHDAVKLLPFSAYVSTLVYVKDWEIIPPSKSRR